MTSGSLEIGILLVTHGGLGHELVLCAQGVVGQQTGLRALGLENTQSPENFEKRLREVISEMASPAGVLVLADMLGGTPCNVCLRLLRNVGVTLDLVTGVNLPMVLTSLANRRRLPLAQLAQKLVDDAPRSAQRPALKLRDRLGEGA